MKQEIIYTEHYALIVSDEQIEDVRPFIGRYHLEKGLIINQFPTYLTDLSECKLIIAHRPLTDAPILKGVPLLPEFSEEEDVNELAEKEYYEQTKSLEDSLVDPIFDTSRFLVTGFKEGYNKAKETYKYTEEDLRKALLIKHDGLSVDYVIQSLQQPKRPKYFESEMEKGYMLNDDGEPYGFPVHETGKPKTIVNSQCQTELVGEYSYE